MQTSTSAPTRQRRHEAILRLVAARSVRSQGELADLLAELGISVNQATLSRDLRQIGVVKGGDGYAPPSPEALDDLTRACREWLLSAEPVAHQLVLRTPPGGAQPLAIAIDGADERDVVGTLAGDDTVLVICRTPAAATRTARRLLARVPPTRQPR